MKFGYGEGEPATSVSLGKLWVLCICISCYCASVTLSSILKQEDHRVVGGPHLHSLFLCFCHVVELCQQKFAMSQKEMDD